MKRMLITLLMLISVVSAQGVLRAEIPRSFITVKEVQLKMEMRELISDHLFWQRMYIYSLHFGAWDNNKAEIEWRYFTSQNNLRTVLKRYYSEDSVEGFGRNFLDCGKLLAEYADASKRDSSISKADIERRLNEDYKEIGVIFNRANMDWKKDDVSMIFSKYFNLFLPEIAYQLQNSGSVSVKLCDATSNQGILLADMLADGIVRQYPDKFW